MLDTSLLPAEDRIIQPSFYPGGQDYSLHKIFGMLALGWSSKKIRKAHADILPETVTLARAILTAQSSDHFSDTRAERPFEDFKVLIDENMNPDCRGYLSQHFKRVAHVTDADVGLRGKCDQKVWEWAINNSYDVIFTHDKANNSERDLTHAAIGEARSIIRNMDRYKVNMTLSALPLLVHLPQTSDDIAELKKLLRRGKDSLFSYLDNRSTPFIDVSNGKIECGPTYFELRAKNMVEDHGVSLYEIETRKEAYRQYLRSRLFRNLTAEQIRNLSPEKARQIDQMVNTAVGIATEPLTHTPTLEERLEIARRDGRLPPRETVRTDVKYPALAA